MALAAILVQLRQEERSLHRDQVGSYAETPEVTRNLQSFGLSGRWPGGWKDFRSEFGSLVLYSNMWCWSQMNNLKQLGRRILEFQHDPALILKIIIKTNLEWPVNKFPDEWNMLCQMKCGKLLIFDKIYAIDDIIVK